MTDQGSSRARSLLRWLIALTECGLRPRERLVLFAYARYVQWESGAAYPSVATLCKATGYSRRTVQESRAKLTELGILQAHGDCDVHLDLDRIEALGGAAPAPGGRTGRARGARRPRRGGAANAPKPSIQQTNEQTSSTIHTDGDGARAGSWMDGQARRAAVRQALERCGVRGSNLDILAAVEGITPEVVAEEFRAVACDSNVRSRGAVLVNRLAGRFAVDLPTRKRPLERALRAQNEQLERLRQSRAGR